MGEKKRVRPFVSKKINLNDTDVILMCTPGFWENINNQQIEGVLKESSDPAEFVNSLEENLIDSVEGELSNYTMTSFFVVSQVEEKLIKIEENEGQRLIEEKVQKAVKLVKKGDESFQTEEYNTASEYYLDAKAIYSQLNINEEVKNLTNKLNNINLSRHKNEVEKYIQSGNMQLTEGNFDEALFNYRQARKISQENGFTEKTEEIIKIINNTNKGVGQLRDLNYYYLYNTLKIRLKDSLLLMSISSFRYY